MKRHYCHNCRRLVAEATMARVAVNPHDDLYARYTVWTPARALWWRTQPTPRLRLPNLAWLCAECIDTITHMEDPGKETST